MNGESKNKTKMCFYNANNIKERQLKEGISFAFLNKQKRTKKIDDIFGNKSNH